ncbi:MAG: insulinase family protein [Oscillospiraceae bacterium]|nr:insulinase family protein [Oscillospiraceae bacterium]
MSEIPVRMPIGDGVHFSHLKMGRFKVNYLAANLVLPLTRETITETVLVAMMLEKSTKDYPTYQLFSKKLGRMYGASAGSTVQKIGDRLIVTLNISALDDSFALAGEALLDQSAEVLCSMLLNPMVEGGAFDATTLALQRLALQDAIEAEINEKRRYAIGKTVQLMLAGEPGGLSRLGYLEDLETLTPERAAKAWERMLRTAQIEIFQVGMGEKDAAVRRFERAFAGIQRQPLPPAETVIRRRGGELRRPVEHFEVAQSKLCLGLRTDIRPEEPAVNAMRMLNAVLGGPPTSKLFQKVREEMGLCYYSASQYNRTKGILLIDCGVAHEDIAAAEKAILQQVDDLRAGAFTDEEMEYARLSLQNDFHSLGESPYSLAGYYLGQALQGTARTPEEECAAISAVGREDIAAAAARLELDTIYLLTAKEA